MSVYDFTVKNNLGEEVSLANYKGKVLLIVNTASKCGFTSQYEGLENLYSKYKDQGFEILGFPCNQFANQEPADDREIKNFCTLNYGVTFSLFKKIKVNGKDADPLFNYLKKSCPGFLVNSIKWNFTKFLIDRKGSPVNRFSPVEKPEKMEDSIKELL